MAMNTNGSNPCSGPNAMERHRSRRRRRRQWHPRRDVAFWGPMVNVLYGFRNFRWWIVVNSVEMTNRRQHATSSFVSCRVFCEDRGTVSWSPLKTTPILGTLQTKSPRFRHVESRPLMLRHSLLLFAEALGRCFARLELGMRA